METAAGAFAGWAVYAAGARDLTLPVVDEIAFGLWIIPITGVTAMALSNAVNITDGLDGLAGGLLLMSMGALALAAGLAGHDEALAMALVAASVLLPFLYLNRHPAKIIMGDAGALGAGALLAVAGIVAGQPVLLAFVSLVFLAEAASSLVQIVALRMGRRVFRIAPLHHHLEAIGWPETRITPTLWLAGLAAAAAGFAASAGLGYF
jgi:phospho-N-acetylmuramoyl-pentapeptide-transferase